MQLEKLIEEVEDVITGSKAISVEEFIEKNDDFIIFGAGKGGIRARKMLKERGKNVVFFLDNDIKKNGTVIDGLKVRHPSFLKQKINHKILVASVWWGEIAKFLQEKFGLECMRDFVYLPVNDQVGAKFLEHLKINKPFYKEVFKNLSDDYSKTIFYEVLMYQLMFFPSDRIIKTYLETKSYFFWSRKIQKILSLIPSEIKRESRHTFASHLALEHYRYKNLVIPRVGDVVIDGGAFDGDTAFWFTRYVKNKGKIFAFEPVDTIYDTLTYNIQACGLNNVVPIKLGLSNKEGIAYFKDMDKSANNSHHDDKIKVGLTTIDRFVKKESLSQIDFIKMDIEGFEFEALQGAKEVIKKFKPDLAICIYHKPEHLYRIPLFIKELVPEYRLYIDNKLMSTDQTVCFATVRG